MSAPWTQWTAVALTALWLPACSGTKAETPAADTELECSPGAVQPCSCSTGQGRRTCNDAGRFGICACPEIDERCPEPNECGGCAALDGQPGDSCGTCGLGVLGCAEPEQLDCLGDVQNACGGCSDLAVQPGDACGTCGSGVSACDGLDIVLCDGDLGLAAHNACGGCGPLEGEPGSACGPCGFDLRTCTKDGAATECDGATSCAILMDRLDGGEFSMGSPPGELGREEDGREGPVHPVEITRPFLMKTTEVTQEQWSLIMGNNPSRYDECGPDCPVERVSWWDALHYLNELSLRSGLSPCYTLEEPCTGQPGGGCGDIEAQCTGDFACAGATFAGLDCTGYRLPTEAEWEFAARAGTQTALFNGDLTVDDLDCNTADPNLSPIAWSCQNAAGTPHPVGEKTPNAWGLYDVHGNVSEWVWDAFGASSYATSPPADPLGPDGGGERVCRGGGWNAWGVDCRAASRRSNAATARRSNLGFRYVRSVPSTGMATVPPGVFTMGSPAEEAGRNEDDREGPTHEVRISRGFLMTRSEVTQAQWQAVMGDNPATHKPCGLDCPVERVSWWDAVYFLNQLSFNERLETCYELVEPCVGVPGAACDERSPNTCTGDFSCAGVEFRGLDCDGYRLPTEAEWEYAARAGTSSAFYSGPITISAPVCDPDPNLDAIGWYCSGSGGTTHRVGQKLPNAYGLHDMSGNVWEWVWDNYDAGFYARSPAQDPASSEGTLRVRRGGSRDFFPRDSRSASRGFDSPDLRYNTLGFRYVRTLP